MAHGRQGWVAAALIGLFSCGGEPRPSEDHDQRGFIEPLSPLNVAVAGCKRLSAGPRCVVTESSAPITLWWPADASTVVPTPWFGDDRLSSDRVSIHADAEGATFVVDALPPGRLSLVHPDGRRFELELEGESPSYLALEKELGKVRSPAAKRERLAELRATAGERDAHLLDCLDARYAFHVQDWDAVLERPSRLDETPNEIADFICIDAAHVQAAYVAIQVASDYHAALEHLRAARAHPVYLEATIETSYYEGILEQRLGRLDESLPWFSQVTELARKTRRNPDYAKAAVQKAVSLARLGRFVEAEALLVEVEARLEPEDPLTNDVRFNIAWVQILHREDDPTVADPTPLLRELVEHYEPSNDRIRANGVKLNLAIAASQDHDLEEAKRASSTLDRTQLDVVSQVFAEIVEARVARGSGRTQEAREHLERARVLAELASDDALALRVSLARAELEQQTGGLEQARKEYERADGIEDRLALSIAAHEGRSTFSNTYRHGRAHHVELLLELGDRSAALCTVLAARARHLRSLAVQRDRSALDPERAAEQRRLFVQRQGLVETLEQRNRESWSLPPDELARLAERSARELQRIDELSAEAMALIEDEPPPWRCADVRPADASRALLTMHPGSRAGQWWLLLDRAGEVDALLVELDPHAADAEVAMSRALARFAAKGRLGALDTLVVIPLGALVSVDFHALDPLSHEGGPRVLYGLGLGRARRPGPTDGSAAVLVDPSGNLREPAAEAEEVRAALSRVGWTQRDAWAPDDPHPPTLLYYAGHGYYTGLHGWGSYLQLPQGPVTIQQLIAHQRAPAIVVLGACHAGASNVEIIDGGMNLASAFLLAGADLVIAPKQAVDDRDARALARASYGNLPGPGDADALAHELVAALTSAQRQDDRFVDWRIWVP